MAVKMLNIRQVAQRLEVHPNTVRNWIARGYLPAARLPGAGFRRVRTEDVERIEKQMQKHIASTESAPTAEVIDFE
jgi:excisionase family DNA binding protein